MSDYDMNDDLSIADDDTLLLAEAETPEVSDDKQDAAWPKMQMLDRLRTSD